MAWSDEARRSRAIAVKIKNHLGMAAYEEYKRTKVVPPGLDAAISANQAAKKAKKALAKKAERVNPLGGGLSPAAKALAKKGLVIHPGKEGPFSAPPPEEVRPIRAADVPRSAARSAEELAHQEIAAKVPSLADPKFLSALAKQAGPKNESRYRAIAKEHARAAFSDQNLIDHYNTGNFNTRGVAPEEVAKFRDTFINGGRVPVWAVPEGTDVALYSDRQSQIPDFIGKVQSVEYKQINGFKGFGNHIRIVDGEGRIYEDVAAIGGGRYSAELQHASHAAVPSIMSGNEHIPQHGLQKINMYNGPDAMPFHLTDRVYDRLLRSMFSRNKWDDTKEQRKVRKDLQAMLGDVQTNLRAAQNSIQLAEQRGNQNDVERYKRIADRFQKQVAEIEAKIANAVPEHHKPKRATKRASFKTVEALSKVRDVAQKQAFDVPEDISATDFKGRRSA